MDLDLPVKYQVIPKGEQAHLGGYVKGGDDATWYPDLWQWFMDLLGVRSVVDVGCGEGRALAWFRSKGCNVAGVDGLPQVDPDVDEHDFTKGPWGAPRCDLVWCCEFVE